MIGTKLFQKNARVYLLLALYGMLSLLGIVFSAILIKRNQDPSAAAGFMVVFGLGMCLLTFLKSKKPIVVVEEERLELNQTNKPEYVRYKDITSVEQDGAGQIVIKVRDGHTPRKIIIYGKYLNKNEAEQLASFLSKKGWKR